MNKLKTLTLSLLIAIFSISFAFSNDVIGVVAAGIGNIYACEALFAARIYPKKPARKINVAQWTILLSVLREILQKSIVAGGTTLRDFHSTDGSQGYYKFKLAVYGKENKPCRPNTRLVRQRKNWLNQKRV